MSPLPALLLGSVAMYLKWSLFVNKPTSQESPISRLASKFVKAAEMVLRRHGAMKIIPFTPTLWLICVLEFLTNIEFASVTPIIHIGRNGLPSGILW